MNEQILILERESYQIWSFWNEKQRRLNNKIENNQIIKYQRPQRKRINLDQKQKVSNKKIICSGLNHFPHQINLKIEHQLISSNFILQKPTTINQFMIFYMSKLKLSLLLSILLVLCICQDPASDSRIRLLALGLGNGNVPVVLPYPVDYPPTALSKAEEAENKKLSDAFDAQMSLGTKCFGCENLKYFAIKFGSNNQPATQYLTVAASCAGTINFLAPSGPSARPGNDQLFISTQLGDETWLLEPRNCPGKYIKATSPTTLGVVNGLSSNARFWIEYHDNHVHIQSGVYSNYWSVSNPVILDAGATHYMVEFWPSRAWP